jgi:hypothetical protein
MATNVFGSRNALGQKLLWERAEVFPSGDDWKLINTEKQTPMLVQELTDGRSLQCIVFIKPLSIVLLKALTPVPLGTLWQG